MISQTLLIDSLPVLERLTRTAPLGLRFWDEVTGKVVGDGLEVTAYQTDNPFRRIEAVVNHAGVYVLTGLPGLAETEFGSGDSVFWAAPPATGTFKIEVVDTWKRFQPFVLTVDAPVRGIVTSPGSAVSSPPESSFGIPLY